MKIAVGILMLLTTVWTCAHCVPLDATTQRDIHADLPPILAGSPDITKRALEQVGEATKVVEKDWKRPIIISVGLVGAVGTIGWNYIAVQSFISNRRKYLAAEKALEAEKSQPRPQAGDTFCTVKTYLTEEQISARKPSQVTLPCWRLGESGGSAMPPVNTDDLRAYSPPRQLPTAELYASSTSSATHDKTVGFEPQVRKRGLTSFAETWRVVHPYAMLMRDDGASSHRQLATTAQELIELSRGRVRRPAVLADNSARHAAAAVTQWEAIARKGEVGTAARWTKEPLFTNTHRTQPQKAHALAPPSILRMERRPAEPQTLATHPAGTHDTHQPGSPTEPPSADDKTGVRTATNTAVAQDARPADAPVPAKAKKVKTEDITFALTVLNAIGTLPSLILTTLNAYLYRGNPKVD